MSFRLRVLLLVAVVATAASGVTAWLTLQQASRQINESADAEREVVNLVVDTLTNYGRAHGTWEGVAAVVDQLGFRTGQRIQVRTAYGQVLVDTDTLAGRTARPVDSPPIPVNPRPALELPAQAGDRATLGAMTAQAIGDYRSGVLFAACLTRNGYDVTVTDGRYGVPRPVPGPGTTVTGNRSGALERCRDTAAEERRQHQDAEAVSKCTGRYRDPAVRPPGSDDPWAVPLPTPDREVTSTPPAPPPPAVATHPHSWQDLRFCLASTFARRVEPVAPVPLHVHLGAVDDSAQTLSPVPVLAAAGGVAALAVAGSVLLSRRVLRPIRALTTASRRLGAGDLRERVPVAGRDELAGLANSFNRMGDSLQQGEERQRRLVADVAHELRTPLANVRGYLEALRDGVVTPDRNLFSSLYEEAVLQQRVVDDLQELALAEAGSLVYHRRLVDLGELLESSRASQQAAADSAGVELLVTADPQVVVYGDEDRLRQALGNLISNALRTTPAGGRVDLAATRTGSGAVVSVTDTGAGIAPEHLPHVFDRFWRADAARGRGTGGSGLGLAIVRQIVTDHDGTVEVASEVGSYTTFTIRLP